MMTSCLQARAFLHPFFVNLILRLITIACIRSASPAARHLIPPSWTSLSHSPRPKLAHDREI